MLGIKLDPSLLAKQAGVSLYEELELTPKPGLVDRLSSGSHKDMNYITMINTIGILEPYFERMAFISEDKKPSLDLRRKLGVIGREAENAMYGVTGGINTHKGAIWSLGLLVSSVAICSPMFSVEHILETAKSIAIFRDDRVPSSKMLTHGEEVYQRYRVGGAAEEAKTGFPNILHHALPTLYYSRNRGESEHCARINTLIRIMAHLNDTCILYRCGETIAMEIQTRCRQILDLGGYANQEGQKRVHQLQELMLRMNASPGGAADLLAATLFIDKIIHLT